MATSIPIVPDHRAERRLIKAEARLIVTLSNLVRPDAPDATVRLREYQERLDRLAARYVALGRA